MAMHLGGWLESIDPAGTPTPITAMLDERLFTTGDNIRIKDLTEVLGMGVVITSAADTLSEAYLYSPTLDILGQSYITPVNASTAPNVNGSIIRWADYMANPIMLKYDELSRCYINALPGSAQVQAAFVLFSDGRRMEVPSGRHITWRGTFTAPPANLVWSAVNVTWQNELVPGDYAIVGLKVVAPTTLAARLNTRQSPQWYPGVLVSSSYDTIDPMYARPGMAGVWQTFPFTQPPSLEICAVTGAAGQVYMDIVQVNEQPRVRSG